MRGRRTCLPKLRLRAPLRRSARSRSPCVASCQQASVLARFGQLLPVAYQVNVSVPRSNSSQLILLDALAPESRRAPLRPRAATASEKRLAFGRRRTRSTPLTSRRHRRLLAVPERSTTSSMTPASVQAIARRRWLNCVTSSSAGVCGQPHAVFGGERLPTARRFPSARRLPAGQCECAGALASGGSICSIGEAGQLRAQARARTRV